MVKITPKIQTFLLVIFLTGSYVISYASYTSSFLNFLEIEYQGESIVPVSLYNSKFPSLNEIPNSPVFIDNPVEIKISQLSANHTLKTRIKNKIFTQILTDGYFKFSTYLFRSFSTAHCDEDTGNSSLPSPSDVNEDPVPCSTTRVALGASTTGDNCAVASVINNASEPFALGTTKVTWTDGKLFKKT